MGSEMPEDGHIYHMCFQRTDGQIVEVLVFENYNCVYFYDTKEYCMKIDGEILAAVIHILWSKW